MNFLARLSDHASIAISNAQLYAAVQAANLAKSEFVSFVAHELKNPMTSVKGYTELLAAGAVGAINDAQTNFLHTIRSNIERMNTLVSDLNDMSKIEVGRLRLDFKGINAGRGGGRHGALDHAARLEEKNQTARDGHPRRPAAGLGRPHPPGAGDGQPGEQCPQVHPGRRVRCW